MYNWYYGATHGTTSSQLSADSILDLTPRRSGKLHDYQAYLKLKKETLGPLIQAQYKEYRDGLPEGDEGDAFIKFQTDVARKLLAEESDEVKAEVEAFRTQEPEEEALTIDATKS